MNKILHSLAALVLAAAASSAAAADYAVVVNASNSTQVSREEARTLIKRLYLKEISNWPGGPPALPLARKVGTAEQNAFVAQVLGMSDAAVEEHWLRVKQIKGETPPREVGSERIVFRMVARSDGAFAVVTAEQAADAPPDVAVLFEFSD